MPIDPSTILSAALSESRLKSTHKVRIRLIFSTSYVTKGFECLYWFVFARMFHTDETVRVQEMLKEELARYYVKLLVDGIEQTKKDHLQYLPLIFGHCICSDFFHRFSGSRSLLSEPFILAATHLIYETLLGVTTTEVFLRQQMLSLYQSKAFQLDPTSE